MIRSMTGYGKSEATAGGRLVTVEIRSVNHRYGEIYIKLPRGWLSMEGVVKKEVARRLKRGKIEVYIQKQGAEEGAGVPAVNLPLAKAYNDVFQKLRSELSLTDPVTLSLILAQKDVMSAREEEGNEDAVLTEIIAAVGSAVDRIDEMRRREGDSLLADILERQEKLHSLVAAIATRAPSVTAEYADRLNDRLSQLKLEVADQGRLAQEVALMADRSDITEELVRLRSHLAQFNETFAADEPVGRKLDFILQEINREVNTIGSKANDAEIALYVVEMKAELERVREQVQNIE